MANLTKSQVDYLNWLNKANPEMYQELYGQIYGAALGAVEPAAEEPSLWDSILSGIADLAPVYLATEQQKQLNEVNLQRAKNGLSPLDASEASGVSAQVGLSKSTQNTILGAVGIGAAALVLTHVM